LVGLLHALHAYTGQTVSPEQLAQKSAQIEIETLARPIGKQDHYIAAFGGFNLIKFLPDDSVIVEPIAIPAETRDHLQKHLHIYYTGITRDATDILAVQAKNFETEQRSRQGMQRMVELAHQMAKDLEQGRVENFGQILDENWQLKKEMAHNISNAQIDAWYQTARQAGAVGGKILGAGGGGFLLLHIPPERHEAVTRALDPLKEMAFNFEPTGSTIFNMKTYGQS
jgi:D-glycero-alpha-D-manno-heptose-7-phosphate kinase